MGKNGGEAPRAQDTENLDAAVQADEGILFFGVDGEEPRIDRSAEAAQEAQAEAPAEDPAEAAAEAATAAIEAGQERLDAAVAQADDAIPRIKELDGDTAQIEAARQALTAASSAVGAFMAAPAIDTAMDALSQMEGVPAAVEEVEFQISMEVINRAVSLQSRYQEFMQVAIEEGGLKLPQDPQLRQKEVGRLQNELGFEGDAVDAVLGPDTLTALLTREYVADAELDESFVTNFVDGVGKEREAIIQEYGITILTDKQRESYQNELSSLRESVNEDERNQSTVQRSAELARDEYRQLITLDDDITEAESSVGRLSVQIEEGRGQLQTLEEAFDNISSSSIYPQQAIEAA